MNKAHYILYSAHNWRNGLEPLSIHQTRELARNEALAILHERGIDQAEQPMRLATDFVIAHHVGNGLEHKVN